MELVWMLLQAAVEHAQVQAPQANDSGVTCRWLLIGACTPMAVVILALWRALEKKSAEQIQDLKDNYKSLKKD